ncbi:hypothetical protein [Streptomyces catenulae]|uniref:Small hydrophobic membrane protein n=1 Tax=Streptomyces catenulae TaxID=66875 RepID=A0ABV2Z6Q0_9ACTN|nr:hypothetical protein [Streptomyces catenulae]
MALLAFALLVLGVFLGAVAHLPPPVSIVAGSLISAWLLVFLIREHRSGHREGDV